MLPGGASIARHGSLPTDYSCVCLAGVCISQWFRSTVAAARRHLVHALFCTCTVYGSWPRALSDHHFGQSGLSYFGLRRQFIADFPWTVVRFSFFLSWKDRVIDLLPLAYCYAFSLKNTYDLFEIKICVNTKGRKIPKTFSFREHKVDMKSVKNVKVRLRSCSYRYSQVGPSVFFYT